MVIRAQSGRVSGLERKTDRTSGAQNSMKGLKDNKDGLLGIVNKFSIAFGTENLISICGGLDIHCTVVTPHRVANFRVKHFNSDIERTRRSIILLVLILILLVLIFLYRSSVKQIANRTVFRVKVVIF